MKIVGRQVRGYKGRSLYTSGPYNTRENDNFSPPAGPAQVLWCCICCPCPHRTCLLHLYSLTCLETVSPVGGGTFFWARAYWSASKVCDQRCRSTMVGPHCGTLSASHSASPPRRRKASPRMLSGSPKARSPPACGTGNATCGWSLINHVKTRVVPKEKVQYDEKIFWG